MRPILVKLAHCVMPVDVLKIWGGGYKEIEVRMKEKMFASKLWISFKKSFIMNAPL
jgi:hypothetical protein